MKKRLLQLIRDNVTQASGTLKTIKNEDTGDLSIYLYDVIDAWFGVSAENINRLLAENTGKTVHLHINSPGGDVFEARAMATAIANHGNVVAHIDSLAASAATYVALAAKSVDIASGGFFMIHNAWTFTYGNKADLLAMADLLDKIDGTIINDYAKKTGKSADEIASMMAAETWLTGQEALDMGFVDAIIDVEDPEAPANKAWNVSAYQNAPKALIESKPLIDDHLEKQQIQANKNRLRLLQVA